jgi:phosphoglycerate dehydrogenase-like enzyme
MGAAQFRFIHPALGCGTVPLSPARFHPSMLTISFQLSADAFAKVYDEPVLVRLRPRARLGKPPTGSVSWRDCRAELAEAQVIFSGWGAPRMDAEFLRAAPHVKAVFYAGGSTRALTSDAFWQRGIRLSSAFAINAIPVSEYTVSAILLGLKRFWQLAQVTRETRTFPRDITVPGAFGSTVGLVSYGTIGRLVRERLRPHGVNVLVFDPHVDAAEARLENVQLVGLDELFGSADVVSVHTPLLEQTRRLISGRHFRQMRPGAVFINTARGAIVHEAEMIDVLRARPDLFAVLDVSEPEPPARDSLLYTLPNVVLTPHIAGSVGSECQRLGHAMVDEFERFLAGDPLRWEITPAKAALMA